MSEPRTQRSGVSGLPAAYSAALRARLGRGSFVPMPRRKDVATELAEKMVRGLESQRSLGPDAYPLTGKRLAELADPAAPPALIAKAAGKKDFAKHVIVAQRKNLQAPVALLSDLEQLAASRILLEFVLESVCTPTAPAVSIAKLKTKIVPALKKPFEAAVHRQVRDVSLPPTVGFRQVGKTTQLYLRRMPPPPPPRPPTVELAESLLAVLEAQPLLGPSSYPLALERLVELTAPEAPPDLVKKAIGTEPFRSQTVIAQKNRPDAPVALAADRERLVASSVLLEFALAASRTATKHAFAVSDLKKKVSRALQQPFEAAVNRQVQTAGLPASVGWILLKKQLLFLLSDLSGGRRIQAPEARPVVSQPQDAAVALPAADAPPVDFAKAFDEAFYWLDRRGGSHNFVSLVDLRRALPFDRDTFDSELRRLRRANRYLLSAAEGRHGVGPEERQAGIIEDGTLLLYVSRRSP
jgi:hypothetical protein